MFTGEGTKWLRWLTCLVLALGTALLLLRTWNWPLVNDAAQLDYVCFLIDHGMAPYRDLLEMNMPGAYLFNWTVMHTLGGGALAWRLTDLGLVAGGIAAMVSIARPYDWLGGALGGVLFLLYHGKDGAGQLGQRDLIIAVLLLAGYAFLFRALRKRRELPLLFFGICAGWAATIKPLPLPLAVLLLGFACYRLRRTGGSAARGALYGACGLLIPFLILIAVMRHEHALHAFWSVVREELPYYAKVGRNSLMYLLKWSLSPSLRALVLIAAILTVALKLWREWETQLLLAGVAFGAVSYFGQGKGFPYHRYPMLAFVLLWAGIVLVRAIRQRGNVRTLGYAGLVFAGWILPVLYVARASRVEWRQDYIQSLEGDLNTLGGAGLSGHVQCLYTIAECDTTLYRMQLVQSTGLFYDFLIFGPRQNRVIEENREKFWAELERNPPQVFVVGAELYPRGPENFGKLRMWPQLDEFLQENYRVYDQRSFRPGEPGLLDYRIYVAREGPAIWPADREQRPILISRR